MIEPVPVYADLMAARPTPYRYFRPLVMLLLGGYLFFDKPFGWLHVPGVLVFIGEIVLAVGLLEALIAMPAIRATVRRAAPLQIVVALLIVSLAYLIVGFPTYGIAAVRDSAQWYYAAFSVLVATAAAMDVNFLPEATRWYRRVMPWFVVWVPVALVVKGTVGTTATVPDSSVSILAFKGANFAVHASLAVAFLWIVEQPRTAPQKRNRLLITGLGLIAFATAGSQNRAGLLTGLFILTATVLFATRKAGAALKLTAVVAVLVIPAILFAPRVELLKRDLSPEQLYKNFVSVFDRDFAAQNSLIGTIRWREEFWRKILEDESIGLTGYGFGPNLAEIYNIRTDLTEEGPTLRNAHNSHLTVYARMGWLGLLLWAFMWVFLIAWVIHRSPGIKSFEARLSRWALVGVCAMLLNAIFDPSLEGPMQGVWIWSLVGIACAAVLRGTSATSSWRAVEEPGV